MLAARIVFVADPLDDTVAMDVTAQLLYLDADGTDRDIALHLNSSGDATATRAGIGGESTGSTSSAMMIVHDAIQSVGCDVKTVCLGQATSNLAVLLAAGTPGKRLIAPYARIILTESSSDPQTGRADDLAIRAAEIQRERDVMIRLLAGHTGQAVDRVDADMRRTTTLTATEAIAYGLADDLVAARDRRPAGSAR
jgi:ATP-dependent Clp protease protease subunit